MLKKIVISFLLTSAALTAEVTTEVEISQGYRRDHLDFSMSGPHGKPDVLSELKFKKMNVYTTLLGVKLTREGYYLKGLAGYGNIINGTMHDSDYLFNHRKGEFSRSEHHISGDYTADFALTLGKKFSFATGFDVAPHIGYGGYVQRMRFRGGSHTFFNPFDGKKFGKTTHVHGLNSTYKALWYGPQIGFDLKQALTSSLSLFINYYFLYPLKYHAKGHWNLRERIGRHFTDNSDAKKSFGHIATLGGEWDITSRLFVKLEFELMRFYAKGGHARWGRFHQPLHKAHRRAEEVRLTLGYSF